MVDVEVDDEENDEDDEDDDDEELLTDGKDLWGADDDDDDEDDIMVFINAIKPPVPSKGVVIKETGERALRAKEKALSIWKAEGCCL